MMKQSFKSMMLMGAFLFSLLMCFTSCEDILGHWEKPVPVIPSGTPETPAVATITVTPVATSGDIATGSTTALVTIATVDGGTMMYQVTVTNTKPTTTEGFTATVPTAEGREPGTYYVWYYAKGDATHADSEISAEAIIVTVSNKPAATIATAPVATTGDIFAGSTTVLVTAGTAEGGTMMYQVTNENTKPTSTEKFIATVPTAEDCPAGTYYVWYYAKADADHSDSEISATAITVTVTKPAATITTVPTNNTDDIKAGSTTALIKAGTASGGTMMYKVTTTNTKPTSTEGFSATVPTAATLAAGTFYVWYYVKGDDTHADSEISATAITVTVKAAGYTMAKDATSTDKGKLICADGHIHANGEDAACTKARVAMIAYVGSDNGEAAPYNHGLALALTDANNGSNCGWKTTTTDAGHTKQGSSSFTSESGLQYNDATHNSDTYPAFKAAIANNDIAAPTGCSAWFLASGYQWNTMISAAGGTTSLRDGFSGITITGASNLTTDNYWSSTEYDSDKAWCYGFGGGAWARSLKNFDNRVRACLAF